MKNLSALKIYRPRTAVESAFDYLDISEMTRKDYLARVGLFLSFVGQNGFNRNSCLSFKQYLAAKNDYSVSTKNKYLVCAKVLVRELIKQKKLPLDTTYSVKQFRQSKIHKKHGLTDGEIKLIGVKLRFLPTTPRTARLRALYALLAFQGLRQIEIARLDCKDIDLDKGIAYVRGKGDDDRDLVYLAPSTIKALGEYVDISNIKEGSLFRSMGNRKSDRISPMTIRREIGVILHEMGIEKTVHGFRHFYVTELLKTMDMRDVRKFSRHRSLEMLLVYDDETSIEKKAKDVFSAFEKFNFAKY